MMVAHGAAMIAQHSYVPADLFAFGDDHAAVAVTTQILTREKTEASAIAD